MHEGWADVIGQMVEKTIEPAGSDSSLGPLYPAGPEKSKDWDLGEDMNVDAAAFTNATKYQWAYSGTRDDGTTGHSFGNFTINQRMHKTDQQLGATDRETHDQGNMLNVVYKILADGGENAACRRLGTTCTTGAGIGLSNASQIMFDAIQYWVTYNVNWDTLRSAIKAAAFDDFNNCPGYNASTEQAAVRNAFNAIGYIEFPINDTQCP